MKKRLHEKIIFDNNYGLILPTVTGFYKDTILKTLVKEKTKKEEISERIRLLYVAVTRAKEKMIIVTEEQEETSEEEFVPLAIREKYNSFLSIIKSIYNSLLPYNKKVDISPTKDYLLSKKQNTKDTLKLKTDSLKVEELDIPLKEKESSRYSKDILHISTKEEQEKMTFGIKVHEALEEVDFKNPNLDNLPEEVKSKMVAFLTSDIIKDNLTANFYKEYEFVDLEENTHGIIDLIIEKEDKIIIIDYKLKNIADENYDKQLNGYRAFLEKKTKKPVDCYLYSIISEKFRLITK